jgi:hypothetical protein
MRGAAAAARAASSAAAEAAAGLGDDALRLQLEKALGPPVLRAGTRLADARVLAAAATRAAALALKEHSAAGCPQLAAQLQQAASQEKRLLEKLNKQKPKGRSPAAASGSTWLLEAGAPRYKDASDVRRRAAVDSGKSAMTPAQAEFVCRELGMGDGLLASTGCATMAQYIRRHLKSQPLAEWREVAEEAAADVAGTSESLAKHLVLLCRVTNVEFPRAGKAWKAWRVTMGLLASSDHFAGDHAGCARWVAYARCAGYDKSGGAGWTPSAAAWEWHGAAGEAARRLLYEAWVLSPTVVETVDRVALSLLATSGNESFNHALHIAVPKATYLGNEHYGRGANATVLTHAERRETQQLTLPSVRVQKHQKRGVLTAQQDKGHLGLRLWQIASLCSLSQSRMRQPLAQHLQSASAEEVAELFDFETQRWADAARRRLAKYEEKREIFVKEKNATITAAFREAGQEPMPQQSPEMRADGEIVASVVNWAVHRVQAPFPLPLLQRSARLQGAGNN